MMYMITDRQRFFVDYRKESKDQSRVTPLLPAKTFRVLNSILSRNQSKVRVNVQPNSAHAIGGKSAAKTAAEGVIWYQQSATDAHNRIEK